MKRRKRKKMRRRKRKNWNWSCYLASSSWLGLVPEVVPLDQSLLGLGED